MSRFSITVQDASLGSSDTEVFEGRTAEEAAFRAGFSMGAYFAFMIPAEFQDSVGDLAIEAEGSKKDVTVSEI